MQSRSPLSTEIDAILQHRWVYYSITIPKLQGKYTACAPPPQGHALLQYHRAFLSNFLAKYRWLQYTLICVKIQRKGGGGMLSDRIGAKARGLQDQPRLRFDSGVNP